MGYLSPLPVPLFVALGVALFLTPACRRLAFRFGVVDRPGGKKIHGQATPLLGGVAIALALAAGMAASGTADQASLRILVASGFILLLGIWDDLDPHAEALRWWLRLLYEGCLAGIVVAGGVRIQFLGTPWLDVPVTLLWIVGITNAFNLLDNMNGLSAGVAAIAAVTFALLAARYVEVGPEQLPTATAAAALAGACLGFLPANFRSRIFMGDAGSLFLGFLLACLAVQGSWRSPTVPTSIIIPLLVLA
ncbi:MAG TPA: MraY family glycosyltransferase, partial [Candidatus Methylomirabilis sp.]